MPNMPFKKCQIGTLIRLRGINTKKKKTQEGAQLLKSFELAQMPMAE
jgi:hypothetical protein